MLDPNNLTRLLNLETATLSARDAMLVRKGAAIALTVVMKEWKGVYNWMNNSRPDMIACTQTVRK